jgi:hypothetical protein
MILTEISIIENLTKGSHTKIKVSCDICGKIRDGLMFKEYIRNIKNGGYYSCKGRCSYAKSKDTCIEKYGVENPSQSDSVKDKMRKTSIIRYGVDNYRKTKECSDKIKETCLERYGVENVFQHDEFKIRYNNTCLEKYGVKWISQSDLWASKSKETKIKNGHQLTDDFKNQFLIYSRKVEHLTKLNKKELFDKWNGLDYYDNEFIKDNFNLDPNDRNYPTIDHKISASYGFKNNIPIEEIVKIENLCFTKRFINSTKNSLTEEEFTS